MNKANENTQVGGEDQDKVNQNVPPESEKRKSETSASQLESLNNLMTASTDGKCSSGNTDKKNLSVENSDKNSPRVENTDGKCSLIENTDGKPSFVESIDETFSFTKCKDEKCSSVDKNIMSQMMQILSSFKFSDIDKDSTHLKISQSLENTKSEDELSIEKEQEFRTFHSCEDINEIQKDFSNRAFNLLPAFRDVLSEISPRAESANSSMETRQNIENLDETSQLGQYAQHLERVGKEIRNEKWENASREIKNISKALHQSATRNSVDYAAVFSRYLMLRSRLKNSAISLEESDAIKQEMCSLWQILHSDESGVWETESDEFSLDLDIETQSAILDIWFSDENTTEPSSSMDSSELLEILPENVNLPVPSPDAEDLPVPKSEAEELQDTLDYIDSIYYSHNEDSESSSEDETVKSSSSDETSDNACDARSSDNASCAVSSCNSEDKGSSDS